MNHGPPTRPGYRAESDSAHICAVCRDEFDDLDAFVEHWDDEHDW